MLVRVLCPRCGEEGTLFIWTKGRLGSQYGKVIHYHSEICYVGAMNKGEYRPSSLRESEVLRRQLITELGNLVKEYGKAGKIPTWQLRYVVDKQRNGSMGKRSMKSLGIVPESSQSPFVKQKREEYKRTAKAFISRWDGLPQVGPYASKWSNRVGKVELNRISLATEDLNPDGKVHQVDLDQIETKLPRTERRRILPLHKLRKVAGTYEDL